MSNEIQPDISNSTQKIPWYKTPAGKAYQQTPEYKAKRKARDQSPEVKAKKKEIHKAYQQTPEYKAKRKACRQTPEYKAKRKAYRKSPEAKARRKAYEQTPEYKANQKDWREVNPEKKLASNKASHEKRLKKDPLYRAKTKLRSAVRDSFKRIAKNKPANTQTLLACSWEEARAHFESLFKEGMSWDNHGEWHVDHIRPVSSFTDEDLHLMNHISNLQPLWAHENWEKSDKVLI